MEEGWLAVTAEATSDKATKEEKEAYARGMTALAKGLPDMTKGTLAAIKAFQGGDPLGGSAAIMDICSSLASTIGALSTAGRPPGMLVGAVFSMFSMILNFFKPDKPAEDMTAKLEQMMVKVVGEDKRRFIHTAQTQLNTYRRALDSASKTDNPNVLSKVVDSFNATEGNTIHAINQVAEWLMESSSQKLDFWAEVLAAQCQAYVDLMSIPVEKLGDAIDKMRAAQIEQQGRQPTDNEKKHLEERLQHLKDSIEAFRIGVVSNNPNQLKFLKAILTAARNAGPVWCIGTGDHVYYREFKITPSEPFKRLSGEVVGFAATRTRGEAEFSTNPSLAVFGLQRFGRPNIPALTGQPDRPRDPDQPFRKGAGTYMLCGNLRPPSQLNGDNGWQRIVNINDCYDIWATPGKDEGEVYLYAAHGGSIRRYKHGFTAADHPSSRQISLAEGGWQRDMPENCVVGAVGGPAPRVAPGRGPERPPTGETGRVRGRARDPRRIRRSWTFAPISWTGPTRG